MGDSLKILFVEDKINDAELIWREIERKKIDFQRLLVDDEPQFIEALASFNPDLIISDYSLPQYDGMKVLMKRNELAPFTPFILVTGSINEEVAVECIKSGADDYILKENLSRLVPAILNSLQKSKLAREMKSTESELLKSEQRLQKAQSIAHVGNWELDFPGREVWCSDEALKICGFPDDKHEISLDQLRHLPLPEYLRLLDEMMNQLLRYNEANEVEFKIKRLNDGAIRYVISKAELASESGGEGIKVIGVIQDITERKIAEDALEFKNLLLQTQQETSNDAMLVVDVDDHILNFNKKFMEFFGIPEELIESGIDEKVLQYVTKRTVNPEEFLKRVKHIYEHREEISHDEMALNDGHIFDRYSAPMFGPDNKYYGRVWYFHDITDNRLAENAILESENKYRNIFENIQDLYYETALDGTIIDVSPSIVQLSKGQYNRTELIGKSILDYYTNPGERESLLGQLKTIGSVTDFEIGLINRDGSIIHCSISCKVILNSQGTPEKIIGSVRDISERRSSEDAIRQERLMLRTLIDNLPDPIYVEDIECRKVIANKADIKNTGKTLESEVLGKNDLELFPGEIGKRGYAEDKRVIDTGKPVFDLEEEFVDKDGKKRWLQTFKVPLQDKNGRITGLVGIGHDITQRKENEKELITAKEKAEESDKLKTAFLHNISHEIRTPMNAIVGFSALLGEPDLDSNIRQSYIDLIMQSSNHLLAIISDIVDISNIEANLVKISKHEINLNQVLKSMIRQFSQKAEEKKIKLECENSLPDTDLFVLADSNKLSQILSNLLSNAIKFTDKGVVRYGYKLAGDYVEFSVSDTGIGIAPEHFDRIFDRFYQVQSTVSRLYEGTGLGLAISKAYTEQMGGRIWLTSEPGKETTFNFTIPFEKTKGPAIPVADKKKAEGFVFPEKRVILIAEDVESNFKLIKYFLSDSNAEVIHAFNGKEAVEKFNDAEQLDLILMDIKMPVMDGYTATKLIREKNPDIPIIAQTAYADDRESAFENGCNGFISKPFDKKALFKVLREFI